jgi:hypothetical protein
MKYLLPLLIIMMIGCEQKKTEVAVNTNSVQQYSIPQFADSASFNNMQQAFPVIEKIYRDYAEKNHFPAISFGIKLRLPRSHYSALRQ